MIVRGFVDNESTHFQIQEIPKMNGFYEIPLSDHRNLGPPTHGKEASPRIWEVTCDFNTCYRQRCCTTSQNRRKQRTL